MARSDSDEFAAWVRPHLVAMSRLAARLAPGADRDDVVQEALTRAWRKRASYDEERGTPQVWLLAIVADQCRRARTRTRDHLELVDRASHDPQREADLDLERAIRRLPRKQRLAVELHYFVGLSVADTAQLLDCAPGTVKSQLSDARAHLRRLLEVRDG